MSDETVKEYAFRLSDAREGDSAVGCFRFVRLDDYWKMESAYKSAQEILDQIRAALGIGPGTDVVRAAERARADRERMEWLSSMPQDFGFPVQDPMTDEWWIYYEVDPSEKECRSVTADTLRHAIDAARRAEGEKA